jgi:hypothetical protein
LLLFARPDRAVQAVLDGPRLRPCGWDWRGYPARLGLPRSQGGSVGRVLDNLIQANPGRPAAGSACMAVTRKALCGGP